MHVKCTETWSIDDAQEAAKLFASEPGDVYVVSRDPRGKYYVRPEGVTVSSTTPVLVVRCPKLVPLTEWLDTIEREG